MESWIYNNIALLLELLAVIAGIIYVFLAAKANIYCWIFGIIGSVISIYIFLFYAKLYAEALLYLFYVFAGIYGWITWGKTKNKTHIYSQTLLKHVYIIAAGILLSFILFKIISFLFTDAQKPFIDSLTTIFSFIATYLTAKKCLENWLYWIVIDAISTYLYFTRGLELYALLMFSYTFIAIYGYMKWKKLNIINID